MKQSEPLIGIRPDQINAGLSTVVRKNFNKLFRQFLLYRCNRIDDFCEFPTVYQQKWFRYLIDTAKQTEWGQRYGYSDIYSYKSFAEQVPVSTYEDLKPEIDRMMLGDRDVLWPGQVTWYSKSSGTTGSRSKFIPVTEDNLRACHIRGTWDTMSLLYRNRPDARQFECKSLVMGGSIETFEPFPQTQYGDVSAIMTHHMPQVARPFFTPDFETALMADFEKKIQRMVEILSFEKDLVMIGGVPTWTLVLAKRVLEYTGKKHLLEVWPNLQAYVHGGVSFLPYREQFRQIIPSDDFIYQEIYNASEGYFAAQDILGENSLLLLLDNGVFYEFLPMEEWDKDQPKAIRLEEVEIGKTYALLISTSAGLWRYKIGDTIQFTSTEPYRIQITGRTQQHINAFGEEVMVANTDLALARTCASTQAIVTEYSVAPVFLTAAEKGGHEWVIEFEKQPENISEFAKILDQHLQKINSDYEAKRYKDMALVNLKVHAAQKGTFHEWLRRKNKLGGQNKVPRLSNERQYIDELLQLAK